MADYSFRLNSVIPGGAHTYSRGDDQFPQNAPQILSHGKESYVWDAFGNKFLDYGMALRAVNLGYANEEVNQAAIRQINFGNNLTRASLIELEAAETFVNHFPVVEMVKFAKNGSSATSAAVKLARAYTGRTMIVRCVDHPFFSYDDWFIGDTVIKRGVPSSVQKETINFKYNDIGSLENIFSTHEGKIAGVILEPATSEEPRDNFLKKVQELCRKNGAVFILDEMITGFRWHLQGAHTMYGLEPDLITFGKAMANGFSVAAVAGKKDIMSLGGIKREGQERVFLMSSTHGAEMCGLGAFIATLKIMKREPVIEHMWSYGSKLKTHLNDVAKSLGLEGFIGFEGIDCSPTFFTRNRDGKPSFELRTVFAQEMIKAGVMMPWVSISFSHGDKELTHTVEAAHKAMKIYQQALEDGYDKYLEGAPLKPVFRKVN